MVSSMAVSAAYAHDPTGVSVTTTETTATITWTHTGSAGCADSGNSGCLTDVDIMRIPGQTADVNYTTLFSNSTAYVIVNNATGLSTWTDHSLPEGTVFSYQVCHGDPDTHTCAVADTNATNAGGVDPVFTQTKAVAINATSINFSMDQNSAVVSWAGPPSGNHTAVTGLKIEYSLDGGTNYTTATSNSTQERSEVAFLITGLQTSQEYIFRVAAVTESIGGGGGITSKSASGNTGTTNTFTASTLGEEVGKVAPPPKATSYSSGTITDGNLQVTVKENSGWDRTLNVALYTNIREDQTKQDSDTYIIWNYFDPVHVSDPHGYFNNVNVVTAQSGVRTMDVTYEITWNKSLAKSDVILETSNFQSKVGTTIIKEAWKSFPVKQISYETPEETSKETIMTLFDGGIMNHLLLNNNIDHTLLSAVDYFVYDEIIDVSQDEKVVLQQEQGVVQLFEKITLSQDNVKVGHKYLKTLVISGTLKDEFHQIGEPVTFYISSPDGTDSQITAVTTSARTFKVPIIIDEFESGIYQFQPSHKDLLGEPFSFKH